MLITRNTTQGIILEYVNNNQFEGGNQVLFIYKNMCFFVWWEEGTIEEDESNVGFDELDSHTAIIV